MTNIDIKNKIIIEDMECIFSSGLEWKEIFGKRFYITGAYGMLASYFVAFLCYLNEQYNANITIYAVGRDEGKMKSRFGQLVNKEYFHQIFCDITDKSIILPKIDYLIHAASAASPDSYVTIPVEVAEANAIGTYNLLNKCKNENIKGFLLFSTGDIYGKVEAASKITEDMYGIMDPLDIHSCYGESKRMAETWCSLFSYEYGVPTRMARIGHTYGPTMDVDNDPRVFASFMKCILKGRDIEMFSDGSAKRPFCYIADATVAFFLILMKGENARAYNVCNTDEFLSIKELADILVNLRDDIKISVKKRERDTSAKYLENASNRENCPVEDELVRMGWKHNISVQDGFTKVFNYLKP